MGWGFSGGICQVSAVLFFRSWSNPVRLKGDDATEMGANRGHPDQWIWWFGPAAAAVVLCFMYNLVPPHHSDGKSECPKDRVLMKAATESPA